MAEVPHFSDGVHVAKACTVVAAGCALVSLSFWALDGGALPEPGAMVLAEQPSTSMALLLMAAGLHAAIRGARPFPIALLLLLALAAAAWPPVLGGTGDAGAGLPADAVGEPSGALLDIVMVALSLAIGLAARPGLPAGRTAAVLASLGLGFGALSLLLAPQGQALLPSGWSRAAFSLPSGVAIVALSAALIAYRPESGWGALIASPAPAPEWKVLRLIFPLIIVAPVLASLLEAEALDIGASPLVGELLSAGVNVAVVAMLLFWTATRMIRQRGALEELTRALDMAPIALTDPDGRIVHWSRGCTDLYGWSADEAVGRYKRDLLGSRPAGTADAPIAAGHAGETAQELDETGRDGTRLHVLEHRRQTVSVGRAPAFALCMTNIGDRVKAEAALRAREVQLSAMRGELIHVSRLNALGEMAAGIAHELNQPLAAAVNFIAAGDMLLKQGQDRAAIGEMLDLASSQALRAGEIIQRMRDFVTGRDPDMRPEPLTATLRDGAALALMGQDQGKVRIAYDLCPDTLVHADRVQVQQVLVNLLRNSIEALRLRPPERREIVIATRMTVDWMVEISVCDTGPGIPQSVLSRLYTPFTSTKGGEGMGIGLSICRRIVEAHGGKLMAENRDAGGACFRFTLPLADRRELAA